MLSKKLYLLTYCELDFQIFPIKMLCRNNKKPSCFSFGKKIVKFWILKNHRRLVSSRISEYVGCLGDETTPNTVIIELLFECIFQLLRNQ